MNSDHSSAQVQAACKRFVGDRAYRGQGYLVGALVESTHSRALRMRSRDVLLLLIALMVAGATSAQTCSNGEKRLHAEDECIPGLLFNYLYCLQISGGGRIEVTRKSGDENAHSSEITVAGSGSGVILKGAASVGYKQAEVAKATRELQEKISPDLADKCERIANEILGIPPAKGSAVQSGTKTPVASRSPVASGASKQSSDVVPASSETYVPLETAFSGFSCQTASYGSQWAEENRKRIEGDLYSVYGCSEPPEASSKPGFSGNFHTPTNSDGPWPGFASQSTILYYDPSNKSRAEAVARDLSRRYHHKFVIARGAGQGIPYQWFKRTIEVHLREIGT